jgi:rare lipoprotein A (peptidoglycan hydrolase)
MNALIVSKAGEMGGKQGFAAAIAAVVVITVAAPVGASSISDKQAEITAGQARIGDLATHLQSLLGQLQSLDYATAAQSTQLGISYRKLDNLDQRALRAREAYSARAREAYKRGVWPEANFLLGLRSLWQIVSFGHFIGSAIQSDQKTYRELVAAQSTITGERSVIESRRQQLFQSTREVMTLRQQIQSSLDSERALLQRSQAELSALEAARRRAESAHVSPAVEAARSARQIVLDGKLAALLAWYAPASGAEPFMPAKLAGTGIVTDGTSSWYGPGFDGRRASSGATYHQDQFTAASLVLPFGTLLKVTYNSRAAVVVITDRGPYVTGRVLDLSAAAAQALGLSGVKQIHMEILRPTQPAPPFP